MALPRLKITVQNCQFVLATDLFKGLRGLWDLMSLSDPPFTWGDCNRSMVMAKEILDAIHYAVGLADEVPPYLSELEERIAELPDKGNTYVDLEN